MSAYSAVSPAEFWEPPTGRSVKAMFDYGRFMSRGRFSLILSSIQLNSECMSKHPHAEINRLVDLFNERRSQVFFPGWDIVVDEGMSKWTGKGGQTHGFPTSVRKIKSKPTSTGFEFKMAACATTGITIGIELQEAAELMHAKEHRQDFGAGTSVLLRLVEKAQIAHTGRTIVADSAFASVRAAVALHNVGLGFIGLVKTATKGFPTKALRQGTLSDGGSVSYRSKVADCELLGVAWQNIKRKTFVSTVASARPCKIFTRKRLRQNENGDYVLKTTDISQPECINRYFASSNKVDVHNQLRASINLESKRTWRPKLRQFATILSMCVVDAYLAYSYEMKHHKHEEPSTIRSFALSIADELVKASSLKKT